MAHIPIFDGTFGPVIGTTPFGYFDNEVQFQQDAVRVGKQIVYKLGFPVIACEIQDVQIYSAFEDAIITYSNEVNKYNIKENLLNLIGTPTTNNLTHKEITPNLGRLITIAQEYGNEAGSGGNVDYKKGYITTVPQTQIYDIDTLWGDTHEIGSKLEIKRVYHQQKPASTRYFGPYNMQDEFGWSNMNYTVNYLMTPISDDLLKMQQIEFNDTVRKSNYSFWIRNNKIQIFPVPNDYRKIYFEYVIVADRDNPLKKYTEFVSGSNITSQSPFVSDFSNAPYDIMAYTNINQPGKSWIREFTFGLVKELLGSIRSKYSSLSLPDGETTLDGDTLRSEGTTIKDQLLEQLRDMLEQSSRRMQIEAKQAESENLMNIMKNVPSIILIG